MTGQVRPHTPAGPLRGFTLVELLRAHLGDGDGSLDSGDQLRWQRRNAILSSKLGKYEAIMKTSELNVVADFDDCPCGGRTLDKLIQPAVLVVLAEGPLHGYCLAERIGQSLTSGGQKPDASGVYRSLKAMEARGLVASSWTVSESGPAKRSYQLTPAGQRCLEQWVTTLEEYRQGITSLLKAARKAVGREAQRQ
jgi:DNA-binding PadR family transcriptional regulator